MNKEGKILFQKNQSICKKLCVEACRARNCAFRWNWKPQPLLTSKIAKESQRNGHHYFIMCLELARRCEAKARQLRCVAMLPTLPTRLFILSDSKSRFTTCKTGVASSLPFSAGRVKRDLKSSFTQVIDRHDENLVSTHVKLRHHPSG